MSKAIESKIKYLAEKTHGSENINSQDRFIDLPGWDSLRHAEFIISLQKEFGIRLTPSEIAALVSLSAAYEILLKKT